MLNGQFFIEDQRKEQRFPQVPAGLKLNQLPLLISVSDQGPINVAGLDFVQYKLSALVLPMWDSYHRSWNDCKDSLKKSKGQLWKTLLQYALFYNVNYGPANTGGWWARKKSKLAEFLERKSWNEEPFLSYLPFICMETGQPEPVTEEQRHKVFSNLANMRSITSKGPVTKLMRWYSFFQSADFYSGEVFASKMIMTANLSPGEGLPEEKGHHEPVPNIDKAKDPKEELRLLKLKHGCWGLAPRLVTLESFWKKELICTLCSPCWLFHSQRAKNAKTPVQIAQDTAWNCKGMNWGEELLATIREGCFRPTQLHPGEAGHTC